MAKDWKLSHLALVVEDLDRVIAYFEKLGIGEIRPEIELNHDGGGKSRVRFVVIGDTEIEFFQPVAGESTVTKFLARHGEGLHHLSFHVGDLDAEVKQLTTQDVGLISRKQISKGEMAFLDISEVAGVVLELEG